jgi:hypothetical protein
MKKMKKSISSSLLALAISFGAATAPVQKAEAGAIVMAAASTVALPVTLAVVGMFGGFGASVFSIYWAIDHREKSWAALGIFMLDEHLENGMVNTIIAEKYPELDSYLIEEIAELLKEKANFVEVNAEGFKDIVLTEEELSPVLDILSDSNPELANKIKNDLTKTII